jgi:hypothetical protein
MRRIAALLLAGVVALLAGFVAPAFGAGPSLAGVVAALEKNPVYLDPGAGEPHVDPVRLAAVMPKDTYFAALPTADIAATAVAGTAASASAAALPALLSSQVGKGGTFVVLVGGKLYGSSTTIPGSLGDAIGSAQAVLPATGDGTGALVALMRSLSGSGNLTDTAGPSHAGGPVGPALLIVLAVLLAVGALVLWWWIRRPARPRRRRRGPPLRDLVEIDHEGNIVRRTPARDRQR